MPRRPTRLRPVPLRLAADHPRAEAAALALLRREGFSVDRDPLAAGWWGRRGDAIVGLRPGPPWTFWTNRRGRLVTGEVSSAEEAVHRALAHLSP